MYVFSLFRYLVDSRWFKQWKKYVGFDSWDKYQMGDQNVYPGPIDNSGLLKGNSLTVKKGSSTLNAKLSQVVHLSKLAV